MTAFLLQSQYAQGETGNNERFSTPAVHIILGSWHLESSAETKILKLTMGFLNLLNINTFQTVKDSLMVALGRGGRKEHLQKATKNLDQNKSRIFVFMDGKKIILWKLRRHFLTDNMVIVQKYFPQTHIKEPLLFYCSIYPDTFQKKPVTLANNVSLSSLLANLLGNNRYCLFCVKQLDWKENE